MADRDVPGQKAQIVFRKGLADETDPGPDLNMMSVRGSDPGALLPPVLEGIESEKRGAGNVVFRRKNAKNAALLVRFVVENIFGHSSASLAVDRGQGPFPAHTSFAQMEPIIRCKRDGITTGNSET